MNGSVEQPSTGAPDALITLRSTRHGTVVAQSGPEYSSAFVLHCAAKVLLGVAVARASVAGAIHLDRSPRSYISDLPDGYDGLSLRDVLRHDAGLDQPSAMEFLLTPTRAWPELLAIEPSPVRAYSDVAAWMLAGELVERGTGLGPDAFVRTWALEPLGVEFALRGRDRPRQPLVVPVETDGTTRHTLLGETRYGATEPANVALGYQGTVEQVGRVLDWIARGQLGWLEGADGAAARLILAGGTATHDRRFGRTSRYGLGVTLDTPWQFTASSGGGGVIGTSVLGRDQAVTVVACWRELHLASADAVAARRTYVSALARGSTQVVDRSSLPSSVARRERSGDPSRVIRVASSAPSAGVGGLLAALDGWVPDAGGSNLLVDLSADSPGTVLLRLRGTVGPHVHQEIDISWGRGVGVEAHMGQQAHVRRPDAVMTVPEGPFLEWWSTQRSAADLLQHANCSGTWWALSALQGILEGSRPV